MNRIKNLREKNGWTQAELGKRLNVQDSAVSKYESEKIPLTADTLTLLSNIFDVSTDYILCISLVSNPENSSWAKPKIIKALEEGHGNILETFSDLSPELKSKLIDYLEMLKTLDEVKSGKSFPNLRKKT